MRGIITAVIALAFVFAVGLFAGWTWRGAEFDAQARVVTSQALTRAASRNAALEAAATHARAQAALAVSAAEQAEAERAAAVEALAKSTGTDIEIVNAIVREATR